MDAPALSVVVPLIDDHGMAEACLDSWNRQTYERARLQVVVVDHGVGRRRAARLRARLSASDLWVEDKSRAESDLYDRGARAASSPLLLFTEAHCVARPFAAQQLVSTFCDETLSAAVVGGSHLQRNALGRMQTVLEQEWHASWPAGHPRTVSLRGFAIRRETYLELGGFQSAHGRFCETALGIALARNGRRIGRTDGPSLEHMNCPRIRDLASALAGCARGQLVWREEMDRVAPGVADEWLGEELTRGRPGYLMPASARALLRGIASSLVTGHFRIDMKTLSPIFASAMFGRSAARIGTRLAFANAVVRWWMARTFENYRALWTGSFDLGVSDHPMTPVWPSLTSRERAIAEFPDGAIACFHARERWGKDGPIFRWSGPAALLRFELQPGDHRLLLKVFRAPIPADERRVAAFFNGHRMNDVAIDERSIELRIPREQCNANGRQELVFTCNAFRPSDDGATDRRLLGLPVFGVRLNDER